MSQSKSAGRWLLSSGIWAVANKFLTAVSGFTVNALLTRLLNPEDVGTYFLIFGIVSFCILFCLFGTQQGVVRLLSASLAGASELPPRGVLLSCLTMVAAFTAFVAVLYGVLLGPVLGTYVLDSTAITSFSLVTALWIVLRAAQTIQAQSFRGFKRIDFASTFEGTASGAFLMVLLAVFYGLGVSLSLWQILALTTFALFVSVCISAVFLCRLIAKETKPATRIDYGYAMTICAPLFVATLCLQGVSELHIGILGIFSEKQEVAQYGAAFRLSKFVILPLIIVNSVIPPLVAQLYHTSKTAESERLLRFTATISSIPSAAIVLVILLFGSEILATVFGDFYSDGAVILTILLVGQLVNSMSGSPGVLLAMANEQKVVMLSALSSGIIGIIVSILMAPKMGALGVATGVAIGTALHNVIMWIFCWKKLGIKTHLTLRNMRTVINMILNPKQIKIMLNKLS